MRTNKDRIELEQRLEKARQTARETYDPLTKERLAHLVLVLEEELSYGKAASDAALLSKKNQIFV